MSTKAKAPSINSGLPDTERRPRNTSRIICLPTKGKKTLVSSDPRRARELNPSGCKAYSTFRGRRPVPTGNTLLNGCPPLMIVGGAWKVKDVRHRLFSELRPDLGNQIQTLSSRRSALKTRSPVILSEVASESECEVCPERSRRVEESLPAPMLSAALGSPAQNANWGTGPGFDFDFSEPHPKQGCPNFRAFRKLGISADGSGRFFSPKLRVGGQPQSPRYTHLWCPAFQPKGKLGSHF